MSWLPHLLVALTIGLMPYIAIRATAVQMARTPANAVAAWLHTTNPSVWQDEPGHPDEYPPSAYCSPDGTRLAGVGVVDPSRPCRCRRVVTTEDCEGEPGKDTVCRQYCHEQHCGCPTECHPVPLAPDPMD